ncbi:MAG: class I SAM-dependent methyltransferase family protein [Candidatus Micrarchaeota archaeon]|nr:class I SAM-dependent methyltransferase family protein [Candidatus Micrarchaeota archaeon]
MLGLKVPKAHAEDLKVYLKNKNLSDDRYRIFERNGFIYFPISSKPSQTALSLIENRFKASLSDTSFEGFKPNSAYREMLLKKTGKKAYDSISKGYDLFGNIAVIDAEGSAAKKAAAVIMGINKNVKTVLSKAGAVSGKYRTRKYSYVAGEENYIATYKENGCTFSFDIRKTFFSTRLSFERNRLCELVAPRENVVVMFAGIGPFAIEIAKKHPETKVIAIELNKNACKYLSQNIKLNKVGNVIAELGDVKKFSKKYRGFADRIIMPLPRDSYAFMEPALSMAKRKSTIHYYAFAGAADPFNEHIAPIKRFLATKKASMAVSSKRIVRSYSPTEVEIVLDMKVRKPKA